MISRLSSVGSSADTNMERFNTDASGAGTLELSRLRSVWVVSPPTQSPLDRG